MVAARHEDGSRVAPEDLASAGQVGDALTRLVRVVTKLKTEVAARSDRVEPTAIRLLAALDEGGPMRSTALAANVFSDPSTVSRQVAQLVSAGYVERAEDPEDRRASVLHLTAPGSAALSAHKQARDEHLARVTRSWSRVDRERLAALLDRLVADLTEPPCSPPLRPAPRAGDRQERS